MATVTKVNQKGNNAPPRIDNHKEPGIEKLCRLLHTYMYLLDFPLLLTLVNWNLLYIWSNKCGIYSYKVLFNIDFKHLIHAPQVV